ncbi:hypothetical protein ACFLRN_02500 [Thermoproteota archaeon]
MKKTTSLFVLILSLLVIISVSFGLLSQDNSLTDEQNVMKIAVDYIKENYGIDYAINGEVSNNSFTEHTQEGDIVYNYPTASFRIPEDYFESGQIVNVMVDPDKEEIIKVYTQPSKGFPPYAIDISKWEAELRQGESTSTNITLSLLYTEEEVTVSFSLTLGAFNNMPVGSNYPFPFEAVFEPEQLVLKHQEPHITILTITANEDALLGLYTLTMSASDGNKGIGATLMITVVDAIVHPVPYLGPVWQRPLKNFATSLTVGEGKVFRTDDPGKCFLF